MGTNFEEFKEVAKVGLLKLGKIVLIAFLVFVIIAGAIYIIILKDGSYKEGDKSNVPYNVERQTNNILINPDGEINKSKTAQELWDEMIENDTRVNEYLDGPEELQRLINAQLVTDYLDTRENPDEKINWDDINKDIDSKEVQGIVKLKRAKSDGEISTLKYADPETFESYIDAAKSNPTSENIDKAMSYFTIEQGKRVATGSNQGTVYGTGEFTKYTLTDAQLQALANVCRNEQGTVKGAAAEASLMANLFESRGSSFGTGGDGLYNYVRNSGWFAHAGSGMDGAYGVAGSEYIEVVKKVLVNGMRTVPGYIDEHDYMGDISYVTNNGEAFSKTERSEYVQHVTKVRNVFGSNYTFFSFPDTASDPFGYTSEEKRQEIGDLYYDFDTWQPVNKPDDSNMKIDNILFIGDSIAGSLKTALEAEGAKVISQAGENANFFLGEVGACMENAGICNKGEKFDWNANIVNLSRPKSICLILGQNLCGGGENWINKGVQDIEKLVEKLQKQFPNITIYINSVVPTIQNCTTYPKYMDDYNVVVEKLKSYCSNAEGVTYIQTLDSYTTTEGYAKDDVTSDGLHPNSTGVDTLVKNIKKKVSGGTITGTENKENEVMAWPTEKNKTNVTSEFGLRESPTEGASTDHKGIDIGIPEGTKIYATEAGLVKSARQNAGAGLEVVIDHGNGYVSYYKHNSELKVQEGETVTKGQVIALSGNTGITSGPHLHFEIQFNGTPVDPLSFKYDNDMGNGSGGTGADSEILSTINTFYAKVATWNRMSKTVESDYPEIEAYSNGNFDMTTTKIDYRQFVSGYQMPFDYLWALLVLSEDKDFVFEIADLVYNSEIEITVHDNISTNTNVKVETFTRMMKVVTDDVKVNVTYQKPSEESPDSQQSSTTYSAVETGGPFEKEVEEGKYTIKTTVITTTNTVNVALTKADTWIVNYTQEFKKEPTSSGSPESQVEEPNQDYPNLPNKTDNIDTLGLADEFRKKVHGNYASKYTNVKTKVASLKSDYYYKVIDKVTTINTSVEGSKYTSSPAVIEEKTDKNSEEENFVTIYVRSRTARDRIQSATTWLFQMLQESPRTVGMIDLTKYLFYKATGIDYGVTEFDFEIFDPKNFKPIGGNSGFSGIYGNTIEEKVWFELRAAGYSEYATAGVMGNLKWESGFQTNNLEDSFESILGYTDETYTQAIDDGSYTLEQFISDHSSSSCGAGYGLAQWTYYSRKEGLYKLVKKRNVSVADENTQVEYLLGEITGSSEYADGLAERQLYAWKGYTVDSWERANSPEEAARAFCWIFEKPAGADTSKREQSAREYYEQFKGRTKPTGGGNAIAQIADEIHQYMEENRYTYCVYYCNSYEECGAYGKSCGLDATFEKSKTGHHNSCCATFVSWVLQEAGYVTEAEHNSRGLNGAGNIANLLIEKGWTKINSVSELEPGDVIRFDGHIEIYAGDGKSYNAGSGNAIRNSSPAYGVNLNSMFFGLRAPN